MALSVIAAGLVIGVLVLAVALVQGPQTRRKRADGGDAGYPWGGDGGSDSGCDSGSGGDCGGGDGGGGGGGD